jgi:hypothetical protein
VRVCVCVRVYVRVCVCVAGLCVLCVYCMCLIVLRACACVRVSARWVRAPHKLSERASQGGAEGEMGGGLLGWMEGRREAGREKKKDKWIGMPSRHTMQRDVSCNARFPCAGGRAGQPTYLMINLELSWSDMTLSFLPSKVASGGGFRTSPKSARTSAFLRTIARHTL